MKLNESETRQQIIDKRLSKAGWNVKDPSEVTEELDIRVDEKRLRETRGRYEGHLFADYALLGKDGYPLAIVEAKKTSRDAEEGKEQAFIYAKEIQKINPGKDIPFVTYTNGYEIHFWDTERYPPRKVYGFPTRDDLDRIRFLRNNSTTLSEELINKDIAGRSYQIQAIRAVLESIQKKQRKFLLVMATGTGKTRVCIALVDVLMSASWVQRVLFLVDRVALRDQALEAFKEHLPNAPSWPKTEGHSVEKEFATDRRVYVSTYPTMLNEIESDDCKLSPHFFDLIVADESHRSIYNVYKNIFEYFDSMQLGLTATPTDHIDHNTFELFECENEMPTFNYSYEEAINNIPPYLSDFEVLKIRSKFMKEGISSRTMTPEDAKKLLAEGKDPDEIDYEGSELERTVTNKGTNALIVREFMEECIKSPDGVLPGKTIFFAISKKHANRLVDTFDRLFPEYKGQIARVLISGIKGVHGKGALLDRFKNYDMPRIAVSVDMLDTGIDVREIVNLVFAKPVYSYTKFWQMIGRGTRILDEKKMKPWCLEKDKFLIIDMWENFEYFDEYPKGITPDTQKPLPVRLFEARLDKLSAAIENEKEGVANNVIKQLRQDIQSLPKNSVIVLDAKADLELVENDHYWKNVTGEKLEDLRRLIAPVMRAKSQADFKAMRFEVNVLDMATAHILGELEKYETIRDAVIEQIDELPLSINVVRKEKDYIEQVIQPVWWNRFSYEDLDILVDNLGPLMKFKDDQPPHTQEKFDLMDEVQEKEYVEFGPDRERMTVKKYREKVEAIIMEMVSSNLALQKLEEGKDITDYEIEQLANILESRNPWITEDLLRKVYDNKRAKFMQFIKFILGQEELKSFTEEVSEAFENFIAEHNTYSNQQIQFLITLRIFILRKGTVEKRDLVHEPFTKLDPDGIMGLFKPNDINEIMELTKRLAA
ncbi:DEAD/DEAH box helicase family protein [Desulfobacterota bacterium AH_259_B03_O07]|nr:DEAD/DEAH box helicase family protein [Desulfobacterota bacterium AH_259_B03_O07]